MPLFHRTQKYEREQFLLLSCDVEGFFMPSENDNKHDNWEEIY